MEGLGACIASWIGSEPLDDLGHMWLERARNGQVENRGRSVSTVFEVMDCSTRHKNERTLVNVSPLAAKQNGSWCRGLRKRCRPLDANEHLALGYAAPAATQRSSSVTLSPARLP